MAFCPGVGGSGWEGGIGEEGGDKAPDISIMRRPLAPSVAPYITTYRLGVIGRGSPSKEMARVRDRRERGMSFYRDNSDVSRPYIADVRVRFNPILGTSRAIARL